MVDSRLIGIVTALLLMATTQGARSEITLEHLVVIDQLLSNNDTAALQAYLERNPGLLTGDDELSRELREFYSAATTGGLNYGYTASAVANPLDAPTGTTARDASFQH